MQMRLYRWASAAAVVCSVLVVPSLGFSQEASDSKPDEAQQAQAAQSQEGQEAAAEQPAEQSEKEAADANVRKLKIIKLQHRGPQEMLKLLSIGTRPRGPSGFPTAAPGTGTFPGGVAAATPGFPAPAATRTDGKSPTLIAADTTKNLLFVRGTPEQIEQVEQMIKAFDVTKDDFQAQQFGNWYLVRVADGNVGRLQGILSQLQLDSDALHLGDLNLIAIPAGDSEEAKAALEQAKEVIATLEAKPEAEKKDDGAAAKSDEATAKTAEEKPAEEKAAEDKPAEEKKE